MDQPPAWPLFGLGLRTPLLELRYATDDLLVALTRHHATGVFRPDEEPFDGDSSFYHAPPRSQWKFLTGEWGARAKTSPDWWYLPFAAVRHGTADPIAIQSITGINFPVVRTVNSFSWVGLADQRRGVGTEMRRAVLFLAFAGLGALRAESDAFDDNAASQRVSQKLGYQPNGTLIAPRPSGGAPMSRFLLTREDWEGNGMPDDIEIVGLDACLPILGLAPAGGEATGDAG